MNVLYFYLAVCQYVRDLKTSFWNNFVVSLHSGQDPGNVTQRWNLEQEQFVMEQFVMVHACMVDLSTTHG